MLPRLIFFAVLIGGALWTYRRWQIIQALKLPEVPEDWRELASRDARVAEAIDMRDQLATQVSRKDNRLDRDVLRELDELVGGVVELTRLRHQMEHHLDRLDPKALERDAHLLGEAALEDHQARIDDLQTRPKALEAAAAETVHALRQFHLETLEALSHMALDPQTVSRRLRVHTEALQHRLKAEREIQALLGPEHRS
ncbi:MAG: hypothetical protein ACE366_30530 [Bradymonadia bacterium]